MTGRSDQPGPRGISIGGNATGQFATGDGNRFEVHDSPVVFRANTPGLDAQALHAFALLMLRELPHVPLTGDQADGTRHALADIAAEAAAGTPDPSRIRAAMGRLAAFLAQAGQPALTAVFMTLAMHVGAVNPP